MFRDEEGNVRTWIKVVGILAIVALVAIALWGWLRPTQIITETPAPTQAAEPTQTETPVEAAEILTDTVPEHGDEKPQPQIGHPSLYVETGTEGTKTWTLKASDDEVIVVGGWAINETDGGVYRAIAGPSEVEVTVTDGFGLVIVSEWAQKEFCFRLNQARQFGWAHRTIEPLAEWEACEE